MRSLHTSTKSSPRSPQLEKACMQQRRPNAAKINKIKQTNKQKHVYLLYTWERPRKLLLARMAQATTLNTIFS